MSETVLITGGCGGLGSALAREWLARGAVVALADLRAQHRVPPDQRERAVVLESDVRDPGDAERLIEQAEARCGPVTTVVANAGVPGGGGLDAGDEAWQEAWLVNVVAQVRLARAAVPRMIDRGGGRFIAVSSAAGLLTNLGNAPYSATKHAAVGFAEWLAIEHGDDGIAVHLVAPMGIETPMLRAGDGTLAGESVRALGVIPADEAARRIIDGVESGRFLILTHPEVARFEAARAADRDSWLAGMRAARRAIARASGHGRA